MHKLEEHIREDHDEVLQPTAPQGDIAIIIDKHPLQASASRGEIRSMVLACKVIEAILVEIETGIKPCYYLMMFLAN